jgi:hypothetical protein
MKFKLHHKIKTNTPTIVVDGLYKIGVYIFKLEVVDDSGLRSKPTIVSVRIIENRFKSRKMNNMKRNNYI